MKPDPILVPELRLDLDPSRRRATRNGHSVNFRGKTVAWDIVSELANRFDAYYPLDDLRYAAWGNHVIADGTVWGAVSEARMFLRQIGLDIIHEGDAGYVLTEFADPKANGQRRPGLARLNGLVDSAERAI